MMNKSYLEPIDWDEWLCRPGIQAGFCQTSQWAKIHQKINCVNPYWITIENEKRNRVLGALFGYKKSGLECIEGPAVSQLNAVDYFSHFLNEVEDLSKKISAQYIKFHGILPLYFLTDDKIKILFKKFNYVENQWLTALIDLKKPPEILMKSIHHSARKGIKKCLELGIEIKECKTLEEYKTDFHEPFFETRRQLKQSVPENYKDRIWWDIDKSKNYRYFVACDSNNRVLGLLGTYSFNGVATEIMSERTELARAQKWPVQDLLHWHVFNVHRDLGDSFFNLAGFNPKPKDEKEMGIRKFKEKWSGEVKTVSSYYKECAKLYPMLKRKLRAVKYFLIGKTG